MTRSSDSRITPRNGHTLVVGIVARISGCAKQKEVSLDDQIDHGKEEVDERYQGPVEYRVIATKGKGERLDRPELDEIEQLLRSRKLDLLVMEDLGRLVRGAEAVRLCGIAVDHGTRVIAPNDCIDTAEESWEEDVISACRDHVGHNAHTSKRLKQKLMNRFKKGNGVTPCEIYGYIKPPDAKIYDDWLRDPKSEPFILQGKRRLLATLNCTAVADWFNSQGVPVGKYCRRSTWTSAMVRRFYSNSILKGQPARGHKHTIKHNESGRRISVPNPKGPTYVEFPHLAYFTADEFDELEQLLCQKNAKHRRPSQDGLDPRHRVPRKRTRFPGQHARCWYCGRQYVWGANGMSGNLMCSGSREWRCWNSIGFSGSLATQRVLAVIKNELYRLEGIDAQFKEMVRLASLDDNRGLAKLWAEQEQKEASLAQEKARFVEAIGQYGPQPMLADKLHEIEEREKSLAISRRKLERAKPNDVKLPASAADLRSLLEQQLELAAQDEGELVDWLCRLTPEFSVYLVRSLDGGHLLPRAKVRLHLGATLPGIEETPDVSRLLTRELTLDLFERPQRLRILPEAARLSASGLSQVQIAQQLTECPTATAVGRALALAKEMESQGLTDPLILIESPPDDYRKLRRHKNPKYQFQPLEGYERRPL
jgi:site-specific DNA recombinase